MSVSLAMERPDRSGEWLMWTGAGLMALMVHGGTLAWVLPRLSLPQTAGSETEVVTETLEVQREQGERGETVQEADAQAQLLAGAIAERTQQSAAAETLSGAAPVDRANAAAATAAEAVQAEEPAPVDAAERAGALGAERATAAQSEAAALAGAEAEALTAAQAERQAAEAAELAAAVQGGDTAASVLADDAASVQTTDRTTATEAERTQATESEAAALATTKAERQTAQTGQRAEQVAEAQSADVAEAERTAPDAAVAQAIAAADAETAPAADMADLLAALIESPSETVVGAATAARPETGAPPESLNAAVPQSVAGAEVIAAPPVTPSAGTATPIISTVVTGSPRPQALPSAPTNAAPAAAQPIAKGAPQRVASAATVAAASPTATPGRVAAPPPTPQPVISQPSARPVTSGATAPAAAPTARAAPSAGTTGTARRPASQSAQAASQPAASAPVARAEQGASARVTAAPASSAGAASSLAPSSQSAATIAANDPTEALSAGAAGEVTASERNRYAAMLDVLANFDGGPCFAAMPSLGEETGDLTLDAFSDGPEKLEQLRADLQVGAGEVPQSVYLPIAPEQCAALRFLQTREGYPEFSVYFDLAERDILSGTVLQGRILNTGSDHVSLIIIDNDGRVQNADSLLDRRSGSAGFAMSITLTDEEVETKQLLMAIATSEPVDAIKDFNQRSADIFFIGLDAELRKRGLRADAAMIGFSVHRDP